MPEHWTELEALKPKKINNWDSSSLVPITDYLGKGQRILTRGSITRKADFSWGTLMRHQPPESNSVNCSSLADALMIFCYVHCSSDSQCFIVGQTTPNIISSSWGVLGGPSNTWFLEPTESSTQMASRYVRPFCRVHEQTDIPCYSSCSNKPHLATAMMWPKK